MTDAPTEHTRCPVCGLVVPEADIVTSEEIVADTPLDVSDLQKKYPGLGECGVRTVHIRTLGCSRCLAAGPVN